MTDGMNASEIVNQRDREISVLLRFEAIEIPYRDQNPDFSWSTEPPEPTSTKDPLGSGISRLRGLRVDKIRFPLEVAGERF